MICRTSPKTLFLPASLPPPREPDIVTITALSDPIIDALIQMYHGKIITTYRHPRGIKKRAAILVRIGDLGAIRKALGFAGVRSKNCCSFCTQQSKDLEALDFYDWVARKGKDVLAAAIKWKEAATKTRRQEIYDKYGVRWSSLHALPYGDPVLHTMLGLLHNWLEGVLQHHARILWKLGIPKSKSDQESEEPMDDDDDEDITDDDVSEELKDDLEELYQEGEMYRDTPSHQRRICFEASVLAETSIHDLEDAEVEEVEEEDVDLDENVDYRPTPDPEFVSFKFSKDELARIHACLSKVVIPSWVDRPPTNLGESSHGKLKADQWLVLFSIFLPLILPELWLSSPTDLSNTLLDNFYDLVCCTNIVCSYSVTPESPSTYLEHYVSYRKSTQVLFPSVPSRPNHHFAMHNAEMMKFWGPLMRLSEFAGERHNGKLQKIKTNNHLCEFFFAIASPLSAFFN